MAMKFDTDSYVAKRQYQELGLSSETAGLVGDPTPLPEIPIIRRLIRLATKTLGRVEAVNGELEAFRAMVLAEGEENAPEAKLDDRSDGTSVADLDNVLERLSRAVTRLEHQTSRIRRLG
jgi:hypothetical protein